MSRLAVLIVGILMVFPGPYFPGAPVYECVTMHDIQRAGLVFADGFEINAPSAGVCNAHCNVVAGSITKNLCLLLFYASFILLANTKAEHNLLNVSPAYNLNARPSLNQTFVNRNRQGDNRTC